MSEAGKSAKKISQWSRSGHLFWADPQNWGGSSIAAPHLEQVPCRQDNIVLPRKNQTFSVLLPMKNIEVKSVRMMDEKQPYRAWQWADMVHSREFEKGIFTVKCVPLNKLFMKNLPCFGVKNLQITGFTIFQMFEFPNFPIFKLPNFDVLKLRNLPTSESVNFLTFQSFSFQICESWNFQITRASKYSSFQTLKSLNF